MQPIFIAVNTTRRIWNCFVQVSDLGSQMMTGTDAMSCYPVVWRQWQLELNSSLAAGESRPSRRVQSKSLVTIIPLTEHAEVWLGLENVSFPCLKAFLSLNRPMPQCFYSLLSVYMYICVFISIYTKHMCCINTHSAADFG